MAPLIDSQDLIDATGVAEVLHLSHRNTVSQYQRRYADMPRPIVNLGSGRIRLWLRSEITAWAEELKATGRNKPGRRPSW